MKQQQSGLEGEDVTLKAYVSKSKDREGNIFYTASICDDEKAEVLEELSGYTIDALEKEVRKKYPDIEIERG